MKTIFKYPIEIKGVQVIKLPEDAKILCAQIQNGQLCLWAEVDTQVVTQPRTIEIFGTGHPIPVDMGVSREYIGTVQQQGLVWHVYEYTGV